MSDREYIDRITKDLIDKGLLIESGWIALRMMSLPLDAPKIQVEEMRNTFFAGAQHLFGSIMGVLDADGEPTEEDMRRMDLISKELTGFIQEYQLKHFQTKGRA